MTPLDGSAVNVIIPIVQSEFHLAITQVAWISLAYLLFVTSFVLPFGRVGDIVGFRRIFLLGSALFVVTSVLCGLSTSFHWLIISRSVQGIGACMMMAVSGGLITAIFPAHERGRALGILGMVISIGAITGPSLGGLLTTIGGWRLIFYINLPIGIVGLLLCGRLVPELKMDRHGSVDWTGAFLGVIALGSFVLAVTQGDVWGWTSWATLGCVITSIVVGTAFYMAEAKNPSPILDFGLFKHPVFLGANVALTMNFLAQFSASFLVPKYLIDAMHLSVGKTGLIMMALPISIFILAPYSGALSDRIGTRPLAIAGEAMVTCGLVLLAISAPTMKLTYVVPSLMILGIGAGLFQSPNNSAIMGSVPRERLGTGGAVMAAMRNLGMTLGITVSSVSAALGMSHHLRHGATSSAALMHGLQTALLTGAIFAFIGMLTSAARKDIKQSA